MGQRLVMSREELILPLAAGKRVLDLGAADNLHLDDKLGKDQWLHRKIGRVASHCVGVDIDEGCVNRLRKMGYDMRSCDVEELDLGERFDVVVAGEFIEHVLNVGRFLDSARKHLAPNGILVITTPNVFSLVSMPGLLKPFQRNRGTNPTHVAWYCKTMLRQLLSLNGFEIIRQGFCSSPSSSFSKAIFRRVVYRLFPEWAETLFVICRKGKP